MLIINIGISFIETSALDATNVEKSFMSIINDIYQKAKLESQYDDQYEESLQGETPSHDT
jgi:GTPase SAR1 family protein